MSRNTASYEEPDTPGALKSHAQEVRAYLRRAFPTLGDPDNVVQEAIVRVWRSAEREPVRHVRALLFTVARRLALDACRRDQVIGFEAFTETSISSVCTEEPTPADTTARGQELDLLRQAIAELPPRCREIIELRKLRGLSQREIAARLRITENTVETQIALGMRRCADFLARHGLP